MKLKLMILLMICGMISGCSQIVESADVMLKFPTEEWERSDQIDLLIDAESIQAMYQYIDDKKLPFTSLIIVKSGKIILEEYFDSDMPNEITALYSATKSINSALVGIAIKEGWIESEEVAILPYFLNEWKIFNISEEKTAITLKNILTMSCGFNWNEWEYHYGDPRNIYETWKSSGNRFKFILDTSMREMPGQHFNYNTAASNLVPFIINKSSGMDTQSFAQTYLFTPLGITEDDYIWSKDNLGYCKGGGLNMRPTDLAKIGLLYLNHGQWDGQQIIPVEWIEKSFSPYFDLGLGRKFGYHWYINTYKDLTFYSAEGFMEQKIMICPEKELVVVFTGNITDSFKDNSDIIMKRYILSALLY